jgi:hypothetical protein
MKQILSRRHLALGGIGSLATLTLLGKSARTKATAPEHPNVAVIQRYDEIRSNALVAPQLHD